MTKQFINGIVRSRNKITFHEMRETHAGKEKPHEKDHHFRQCTGRNDIRYKKGNRKGEKI